VDFLEAFGQLAEKVAAAPLGGALARLRLKKGKGYRADAYRKELYLPKIRRGPKFDDWGNIRCDSVDDSKPQKRLEEFELVAVKGGQQEATGQTDKGSLMPGGSARKTVKFEGDPGAKKVVSRPKAGPTSGERRRMRQTVGHPAHQGAPLWTPFVQPLPHGPDRGSAH
jgi:hypothetical protein